MQKSFGANLNGFRGEPLKRIAEEGSIRVAGNCGWRTVTRPLSTAGCPVSPRSSPRSRKKPRGPHSRSAKGRRGSLEKIVTNTEETLERHQEFAPRDTRVAKNQEQRIESPCLESGQSIGPTSAHSLPASRSRCRSRSRDRVDSLGKHGPWRRGTLPCDAAHIVWTVKGSAVDRDRRDLGWDGQAGSHFRSCDPLWACSDGRAAQLLSSPPDQPTKHASAGGAGRSFRCAQSNGSGQGGDKISEYSANHGS